MFFVHVCAYICNTYYEAATITFQLLYFPNYSTNLLQIFAISEQDQTVPVCVM